MGQVRAWYARSSGFGCLALHKQGVLVHARNPTTWEVKAGGLSSFFSCLHREIEASLGSEILSQRQT